ncbi:MAG TPA: FtsW/RodA/SpoVE family cell cycle protein, partial [Patescibacteria group bacterium]|nr:FtsW/RodA/SpoVE family cell cycle protein [Patescibacteria group bacterium]
MRRRLSRLAKQTDSPDRNLFFLTLSFVVLGLIAIADVSAPQAINLTGDKYFFLKQQLVWSAIGVVVLLVTSKIKHTLWEKVALPFFVVCLILLLAVLFPAFGFTALGARRWIPLGFFSLQPSELVKLGLAVYLAKVAMKAKGPASYFVPIIVVAALIMLQPDLGTTLVIGVIGLAQIFVAGVSLWYLLLGMGAGVLGVLVLILTSPYRKERLLTFFEATRDPLGKSYHIRQILLALGSGGIFGVALG